MQFVYLSSVLSHNGAEKCSSVPQHMALQKIKVLKTMVSGHTGHFDRNDRKSPLPRPKNKAALF